MVVLENGIVGPPETNVELGFLVALHVLQRLTRKKESTFHMCACAFSPPSHDDGRYRKGDRHLPNEPHKASGGVTLVLLGFVLHQLLQSQGLRRFGFVASLDSLSQADELMF